MNNTKTNTDLAPVPAQSPATPAAAPAPKKSLVAALAAKFDMEPAAFMATLQKTAFSACKSNEEFAAMCVVANEYGLNPFLNQLYAFPDPKRGRVVPVVGVDGWSAIINGHPAFDGMTFKTEDTGEDVAVTCTIYRKDRAHPIEVTEYKSECFRKTPPWESHPLRMLRHKAMIQAARLAFGFTGITDEDEARAIVESPVAAAPAPVAVQPDAPKASKLRAALGIKPDAEPEDAEPVFAPGGETPATAPETRENAPDAPETDKSTPDGPEAR
jgi:phage recombination protein Bet